MMDYLGAVLDGVIIFAEIIGIILIGLFSIVTLPIWIVPYLICKAYMDKRVK